MLSTVDVAAATAGSTLAVASGLVEGAGEAAWLAGAAGDAVHAVRANAAASISKVPAVQTRTADADAPFSGAIILLIT
ncbi:hypothetical protein [Arthrobacter sp. yr096]|uniref:hypothetical protein n=1 Tax=Arthrobacter sp. yr096 TaxID=1761750 RepID=UPI000B81B8F4|nr:hypothetical protein [Arthrobacter sp. yr096]